MITQTTTAFRSSGYRLCVFGLAMVGLAIATVSVEAAEVPWECSNYSGEAQTRCLNAFIERQQQQIGQLEGRLQSQQEMMGQLKSQIDRQATATPQIQQQLLQPPVTTAIVPPYYPYAFAYPAYPPVGIGLYLGRPWGVPGFYGYYGRPYWGPRFYYRHHGRW
jgi:hypothetical protein